MQKNDDDFKEIEDSISNSTQLLEAIVDFVNIIWVNVSDIMNTSIIYKDQIKSIKLYAKSLIFSFAGSFLLPKILPPITSVTALCLFVELQYSKPNHNDEDWHRMLTYLHAFYYAICSTIALSSFWMRVVEIKKKMIDPMIISMKPKNKFNGLSIA